ELKIQSVRRLEYDILVEFGSAEAARWALSADGSEALETRLRYHMSAEGRDYKVIAKIVPIIFDPADPSMLREIERRNDLPAGCVKSASYIKPIAMRRSDQEFANVMLTIRNVYTANHIILHGIQICSKWSRCWRRKHEPIRCQRCQKYNHIARVCNQTHDTCGICGGKHRTQNCTGGRPFCVSCNSQDHCSRDRSCPTFRRRCEAFDVHHPENRRVYFPTEEVW
ncbi:hypothetical protein PENSPDRAFT_541362, partial [Peniophora sp. CONT]